jgi:hypothetical protein
MVAKFVKVFECTKLYPKKTLGCTHRICVLLTADCLDILLFFSFFFLRGKLVACLVINLEAIGVCAVLAKQR